MSKSFKTPFFHMEFPNFLSEQEFKKLYQIYQKFQFKQKTSDLFHFFQTNQLNAQKSIDFFKENLNKVFKKLSTPQQMKQSFYSVFASYYFKGDYLLCHDDIIQDRIYAFSFYLEDFDFGGELILFNNIPDKAVKSIKPRRNTLVIFEVCDQSYHEVGHCWGGNGRKAVTGWFNVKGQGAKRVPKSIDKFKPTILKDALSYPLDQNHLQQQYFQMQDIDYQFNIKKQVIQGPFYSRRVHRLTISPAVVFQIPGYKLLSSDFYKFKQDDYILLNDPVNTLQNGQNIIDVFIPHLSQNYQKQQENVLIKIVEQDGSLSGIPQSHDSLFIVKRGKKQYYVERNNQQFMIAHFIYVKEQTKVKGNGAKKVQVNKKVVDKSIKKSSSKQPSKSTKKAQSINKKSSSAGNKTKKIAKPLTKGKTQQNKKLNNKVKKSKTITKSKVKK